MLGGGVFCGGKGCQWGVLGVCFVCVCVLHFFGGGVCVFCGFWTKKQILMSTVCDEIFR